MALLAPAASAFPTIDDDEFYVGNYSITGKTLSPGTIELDLTADLSNLASGTFSSITAELVGGLPRRVRASGSLSYSSIDPYETTSTAKGSGFTLTIPRSQLRATLRALSTDALVWDLDGRETTIYQDGVFLMDDDTRDVYVPGGDPEVALFDAWTDLLLDLDVGDFVIFLDGDQDEPLSAPKDPWEVLDIYEDDIGIWMAYENRGDLVPEDLVISGTLTGQVRAGGSGMHQSVFEYNQLDQTCELDELTGDLNCDFQGLYLAEDAIALDSDTFLDGGVNVQGLAAGVGVRMREGVVDDVGVDFTFDYVLAVAMQAAFTGFIPTAETVLFSIHIPVAETSIAGVPLEIGIDTDVILGAEANFSGASALGLAQTGTVGVCFEADIAGDDMGYSATPVFDVEPLLTSPPTLASDAVASAKVWAAIEAQVELNGGLAGGPSARLAAFAQLDVDPAATPWWELSAGGEVEGTLELDLLGFEVAAHTFGLDSEIFDAASSSGAAYAGVTGLASGEEVRWAEDYHYGGTYGDYGTGLVPLDDGSMLFSTWNPAVVAKVDAAGQLQWDSYLYGTQLGGLVGFDGGVLAIGDVGDSLWIGELDLAGNEVQAHQWNIGTYFGIGGVLVLDAGPIPSFLIRGEIYTDSYWHRPWLAYVTYDPSDTVDPLTFHWSRTYDSQSTYGPYPDTFNTLLYDDGDIYVGGVTTAGQPEGTISYNALLMRLDAAGDQVWAKAVRDGGDSIHAVAMGEDGMLLTAGAVSVGVAAIHYSHSFWFGRWFADGSYYNGTTLSEDLWWESYPDTSGYPSYTTAGASIYDTPTALMSLADGGFAAIGYSGLSNPVGWIMSLDSSMNVRWLSTLEGNGHTTPVYLADTGDGLAVLANTTAPAASGYGGWAWDTMLLKFPYDGILAFDPATGMNTRYTKPDMVPPPSDGTLVDLTYLISDTVPVHGASTVTFSPAGLSSWTLDPW